MLEILLSCLKKKIDLKVFIHLCRVSSPTHVLSGKSCVRCTAWEEKSLKKRNRNGKIRRCQECQGQQKFTSFKFTPMWELETNLRQSMWVHSLLYLPASQAVFPGVEPMEWGWRWGKDEAVLLGNGWECSSALRQLEENGSWKGNLWSRVRVWMFGAEWRDRQPPNPWLVLLLPSVTGEGGIQNRTNFFFLSHYRPPAEQQLSVSNNPDSHWDLHQFPELSLFSFNNLFASVIALGFHDIQGESLQYRFLTPGFYAEVCS